MSIRIDVYDRSEYDIWFAAAPANATVKPAKTLRQWAQEQGADITYNLAWFNMIGKGNDQYGVIKGRTLQDLRCKGVMCGYGGTAERLTLDSGNYVSGVKVAIKDCVVQKGLTTSRVNACSRNMCGMLADGRYIHVQSSDGCTEDEVARYVNGKYTVVLLLVQDAGGSTGMYRASDGYLFAPEREGTNGRPVCSVVCIRSKGKKEDKPMGIKVAIDAGHGKYTAGKRCLKSLDPKETREWALNARIAEHAVKALNACGIQTLRVDDTTGDVDVPLKTRTDRANNNGCDYYISIHADAGIEGGTGGGITAFCYPQGSKKSFQLRDAVYEQAVKLTGLRGNRTNPKDTMNLHVCRETTMPAILVEFGFMDSKTDVPIILTDDFARKAAEGVARGICQVSGITYQEQQEKPTESVPAAHWAQKHYESLIKKGMTISETRFDDKITRGEVFALLDQIVK